MGIKSKNVDRDSHVNQYRIQLGEHAALNTATAVAAAFLVPIHENCRLKEFLLGSRTKGGADTGGVNVGIYRGATATAGALLTSATARLATSEVATGAVGTMQLATSLLAGMNGGMVLSGGSVLLFNLTVASASHTVGGVMASMKFELDL